MQTDYKWWNDKWIRLFVAAVFVVLILFEGGYMYSLTEDFFVTYAFVISLNTLILLGIITKLEKPHEEAMRQKIKLERELKEITKIKKDNEDRIFELEDDLKETKTLRDISDRIGFSLDVPSIVEVIAGSLGHLIPYTSLSYVLLEDDELQFHTRLEDSVGRAYIDEIHKRMIESISELAESEDIRKMSIGEVITGELIDGKKSNKVQSFFNGPLVIGGKTVGLLTVASVKQKQFSERQMNILYTITKQVSSAVESLQEKLEEEKGKLGAMVSSISDGLLMVDTRMQLLVVNPALKIMLDLAKAKVSVFDVIDKLRVSFDVRARLEEALQLDRMITAPEIIIGQLYLRPIISPVHDKKGLTIGAILLLQDVTKERELQRVREDFSSMMVHELRTPLDGIKKLSEIMRLGKVRTSKKKYDDYTRLIFTNATQMLELVSDLLDIAKLEAGKFEVHLLASNVRDLVEGRVHFFDSLAKDAKIDMRVHVDESVPKDAKFDPVYVAQVLTNLISNAIKFTPENGTVLVEAFVHRKGKSFVEECKDKALWAHADTIVGKDLQDSLVIAVVDSGAGVPPDDVKSLFDKFKQFRTRVQKDKRGTGLGLAIVKGIIEEHGGSVGAFSKLGYGSIFYFSLPLVYEEKNSTN
jgi:signal transduction histidine kinase/uncharacterized protein YkuJ